MRHAARWALLASLATMSGLVACTTPSTDPPEAPGISQGWSERQRTEWYAATQGSRLIPLDWLRALEQPGRAEPFLADDHIAGFRYVPKVTAAGLPLGFALDDQDDSRLGRTALRWKPGQGSREAWVGLNCAACHTADLTFAGQAIRVEGGPTLADFQGFMESLNLSLAQTAAEPAKWDRFARQVLGGADTARNRAMLRTAFGKLAAWQAAQLRVNGTPLRYGYGRLDAFGHIFNKVALTASPDRATANPADAPVSYPFLWNVHQLDRVQYNALAKNGPTVTGLFGASLDVGALGRNAGEVTGVFADVVPRRNPGLDGYRSSIDVDSLVAMEQQLMQLQPPRWPAAFPKIDATLAETGKGLFAARCASCHAPLADLTTPVKVQISTFNNASAPVPAKNEPPGTDPWMACNAVTYQSATGVMQGLQVDYPDTLLDPAAEKLGPVAPVAAMLRITVAAALIGQKEQLIRTTLATILGGDRPLNVVPPPLAAAAPGARTAVFDPRQARLQRCMTEQNILLGYKARPLTGIWATAPYLHNGSVPNLHEVLLPPAQRSASFAVGTREYDPERVGFRTEPAAVGNTQVFSTIDAAARPIPGNSNAGHDYGNATLDDAARRAIVEYMKTL